MGNITRSIVMASRKYLMFLMVISLIAVVLNSDKKVFGDEVAAELKDELQKKNELKQGDIITFGSYEQEKNLVNEKPESIEWIVLSLDGDKALLLSKYGLDCRPFNEKSEDVAWEDSTIRKWLNGEFYETAFKGYEKWAILETVNSNPANQVYGTDPENDTSDRVFLLSAEEAVNGGFGFSSDSNENDMSRRCAPTEYALQVGATGFKDIKTADERPSCYWMLRTSGSLKNKVAAVRCDGCIDYIGTDVSCNTSVAVRPAIFVDLNLFQNYNSKNVGDVNCDGFVDAKDVTELRRYLAGGWNVWLKYINSDIDGDGDINAKDVTAFRRYLAGGWDVMLPPLRNLKVGDVVKIGRYEQDNNLANGPEDIEWIVLNAYKNSAELVSKYVLDAKPYNNTLNSVKWSTSTLFSWLNNEFCNTAFNDNEKNWIKQEQIDGVSSRVSLMESYRMGNSVRIYYSDIEWKCSATPYAKSKGVIELEESLTAEGKNSCWWWLSSNTESTSEECTWDGSVKWYEAKPVNTGNYGVRPHIRIAHISDDDVKTAVYEYRKKVPADTVIDEDYIRNFNRLDYAHLTSNKESFRYNSGYFLCNNKEQKIWEKWGSEDDWVISVNTYDENYRLIFSEDTYVNGTVWKTAYKYDVNGNKVYRLTLGSNGYTKEISYGYDDEGNLHTEEMNDSDGNSYEYVYKSRYDFYKKSEINSDGSKYYYETDEEGSFTITEKTEASGEWTHEERYYSDGVLTKKEFSSSSGETEETFITSEGKTYYHKTADGEWKKEKEIYNENGDVVSWKYEDSDGKLTEEENEYDSEKRKIKSILTSNDRSYVITITWEYDNNGNMIRKKVDRESEGFTEDSYEYDESGVLRKRCNLEKTIGEKGFWKIVSYTTEYDEEGNKDKYLSHYDDSNGAWADKTDIYVESVIRSTHYEGSADFDNVYGMRCDTRYNDKGYKVFYDSVNEVGGSSREIYLYRSNGSIVRRIEMYLKGKTGGLSKRKYFDYDSDGKLILSESHDYNNGNPNGMSPSDSYSKKLGYKEEYNDSSECEDCDKYQGSISENGNVVLRIAYDINGNGYVEEYEYSEDSTLVKTIHTDLDGVSNYFIEYTYDEEGNVTENYVSMN